MKTILSHLAVLGFALFALVPSHPEVPRDRSTAPRGTVWMPGEYSGWVYFEAKTQR